MFRPTAGAQIGGSQLEQSDRVPAPSQVGPLPVGLVAAPGGPAAAPSGDLLLMQMLQQMQRQEQQQIQMQQQMQAAQKAQTQLLTLLTQQIQRPQGAAQLVAVPQRPGNHRPYTGGL